MVAKRKQELCRSPVAMFRACKVFNTGVDNSVQKLVPRRDNSSFFNTLMRFAQFLCNESTGGKIFLRCSGRKNVMCFVWRKIQEAEQIFCGKFLFRSEIQFSSRICVGSAMRLIPTWRFFQLYLDNLFGIADFKPLAVTLPAFRNYLNQDFSKRRVRNVRNPLAIRFDV